MHAFRFGTAMFAVLTLVGCATSFSGDPHIEDGRKGCDKKCADEGMELAGMVYMGEYSDACVCEVKGHGSASSRRELLVGSAGGGAGAAGVWMQMVAARQRQQGAIPMAVPMH
jgi:hypothetical protein